MDGQTMKADNGSDVLSVDLIGVENTGDIERAIGTFAARVPSNVEAQVKTTEVAAGALVLLHADRLDGTDLNALTANANLAVVADDVDQVNPAALAEQGVSGLLLASAGVERLALGLEILARGGESWPSSAVSGAVSTLPGHAEEVQGVEQIPSLTRRQRDVLNLVAKGQSNQTIGDLLGLNLSTVKGHVRGIFTTLGVRNRTQAVLALLHAVAKGLA
ncbi:MAG: hypothetical protein Alpg2KO_23710 [Alphaproteobacteria bacterium]